MDYQAYAAKKFKELTQDAPANNCNVLIHENGVLVDAGCDCPGGWSAAKHTLEGLIGGRGQVGYTQTQIEDFQMPTVELFLDDPVGAAETFTPDETGLFGVRSPAGWALGVSPAGKEAALKATGQVVAAETVSLFSGVLEAGGLIAQAVRQLKEAGECEILWAWSSCPIAPMGGSTGETACRRAELTAARGTVSIWVRAAEADIRRALVGFEAFRLCIHELTTACTYRSGAENS